MNDVVIRNMPLFESLLFANFEIAMSKGVRSLPRMKDTWLAEVEEHAGIRLKVLDDGQWLFVGNNALYFYELYNRLVEDKGEDAVIEAIGPDELRKILAVTLDQFQQKMRTKMRRVYVERAVRPAAGGKTRVTRESLLYLPHRSYDARIVGMGGGYRLPSDLMSWLASVGIEYKPEHNPRRRQRVRGQARDRYVFAFSQGAFADGFIEIMVSGKDSVLASRNWRSICPHVLSADKPARAIKWFLQSGLDLFCGAAELVMPSWSHTLCFYGFLTPIAGRPRHHTLTIHLLDPHATSNTKPQATRDLIRALVRSNHQIKHGIGGKGLATTPIILDRVKVVNTHNSCGFKKRDVRFMAVQYRFENSCTLASVALLCSVSRNLARFPVQAVMNSGAFCRKVYADVRPQDVVLAAQLARA